MRTKSPPQTASFGSIYDRSIFFTPYPVTAQPMRLDRQHLIRLLFDEYIEMYASRDDRLIAHFSENFSGYTGGGDFLVKDREAWVKMGSTQNSEKIGR